MGIENILEKYHLELAWGDSLEKVYANEDIMVKVSYETDYIELQIEYKDDFIKWSEAFYCRRISIDNTEEYNELDMDINLIIKKEMQSYEIQTQ